MEILTRSRKPTELIMKIQTIRTQRTRPRMHAIIANLPLAPGAAFEIRPASLSAPKAYTESPDLATTRTMNGWNPIHKTSVIRK